MGASVFQAKRELIPSYLLENPHPLTTSSASWKFLMVSVRNVASIAASEPAGPSMKTKVPGPKSLAIKAKMEPLHVSHLSL